VNGETGLQARSVAVGGLAVLASFLLVSLILAIRVELGVFFLGVVLGISLAPIAEYGERMRVPRVASVLLVYAALASLLTAFLWYAVPSIAAEAVAAGEKLDQLGAWYEGFAANNRLPPLDALLERGQTMLEEGLAADLAGQAMAVFQILFYALTILVVALFVTISKDRAYDLLLSILAPRQREPVGAFLISVAVRLRRFVVGTFATMAAVGLMTYVGLVLLGIPLAPLLAALAFAFEIVPIVGPWIAFAPAFAVALSVSPLHALAVAVMYFVIQQIESYVLVPAIHGAGMRLPGLVIIAAIMTGFPLLGVLGALIALPVAVILYAFVHDVVVPWRRRQVEAVELAAMGISLDAPAERQELHR
jgi:predicted PurR-regulated permease PerM